MIHYTVVLDLIDLEQRTIRGHADLQLRSKRDHLGEITLDLLSMNVDSVWIDEIPIEKYSYDGAILSIQLAEPLDMDQALMLSVFYHGKPVSDPYWGGFYFTPKYAYNMGVGMGSDPHPFGRCWYPCIDSFSDRASYDYFITVDSTLTAVCPGSLEEILVNDDKTRTFHWALQSTIPSYLSSIAVGEYVGIIDTLQGQAGEIPVMIYVSQDDSSRAVQTFRDLPRWLEIFEYYFGPYRWEKIGYTSVPFQGGAMEHATAVSFSDAALKEDRESEDLLVHEFAHSWFGNLVTCATGGDMWLNEGWASYCVALYQQMNYGENTFRNHMRANHLKVMQMVPVRDRNIPIYNVSAFKTYSSTIYDKGADVVHTLRYQLGEDRFFNLLKDYFESYAFQSMTIDGFKEFLEYHTREDLTDFFNFWIKDRGFTHFSVDSFQTAKVPRGYEVRVFIRQQLNGAVGFTYGTKVELKFMDNLWNTDVQITPVYGPSTIATFSVPFEPDRVLIDPDEKVSDATIDEYQIISQPGEYMFTYPYFGIHIKTLPDSILLRATRNYIAPDTTGIFEHNYVLDPTGYWTIEGLLDSDFDAEARFFYEAFKFPGNDFLTMLKDRGLTDQMILLYREGTGKQWKKIPFLNLGTEAAGVLSTDFVREGEYCLAIQDNQ